MPTISMFRGIKVFINWNDHQPPHFHASYAGHDVIVGIEDIEVMSGDMPNKQLKMLIAGRLFTRRSSLRIGNSPASSRSFLRLSL